MTMLQMTSTFSFPIFLRIGTILLLGFRDLSTIDCFQNPRLTLFTRLFPYNGFPRHHMS
uniref:Uncharacterized protein n=1 Tax=Rhizophora mucronata TaxID=61149 RepID=A0A2P2PA06_RHIMU